MSSNCRARFWRAAAGLLMTPVCCSKAPDPASQPTPPPRVVYVLVTPTAASTRPPDYRATISAAAPEPTLRAFTVPEVRPTPPPAQSEPPRETLYATIEDFLVRPPNSIGAIWFDGEVGPD